LKANKKEILQEFLPSKTRQPGSSVFGFQKDITLVSHIPRKNRSVILLSTMHDDEVIDPGSNKPNIILDYNRNKGGVAVVDQLCSTYTVSRKTYRWPMSLFYAFLKVAGINSRILLQASAPYELQNTDGVF
jgi:hypothetical protein